MQTWFRCKSLWYWLTKPMTTRQAYRLAGWLIAAAIVFQVCFIVVLVVVHMGRQ